MKLSILEHLRKFGIHPNKQLGQNFLLDSNLCEKIVRYSCVLSDANAIVVEIGPGPGGLTRAILDTTNFNVISIEKDGTMSPLLAEIGEYYKPRIQFRFEDALKVSMRSLAEEYIDKNLHIIANLPYNVATPLILQWLEEIESIHSITVMVQKEVAARIDAETGSSDYGRLSVICQLVCMIDRCFDISPQAFFPPPKVWSTVINMRPLSEKHSSEILNVVSKITFHAFNQRRKMIRSSLRDFPQALEAAEQLNIAITARAENLSPQDYLKMAKIIVDSQKIRNVH